MKIESYSFLKKILGRNTYNGIKDIARNYILIASAVLALLLGLSLIVHWSFLSNIIDLITGTSLLFIAYIVGLIVILDRGVDVVMEEDLYTDDYSRRYSFPTEKPTGYNKTIVLGVLLICFGIAAIYFSDQYKKYYKFECTTFLVDHSKQIYHLDWDNDCEVAVESDSLEKLKGYQIDDSYTLCDWCDDWAEDAEDEYNFNKYFRK